MKDFFVARIAEETKMRPEELDYRIIGKLKRDANLFGAVLAARESARTSDLPQSIIVLSSARLLKEADENFKNELGKPEAVVSTAALACLMTLTPGVQMQLGTLRGVLWIQAQKR